jgi:hypothetical protein
MSYLNETHDPALQSWVGSANVPDNGFPIQNLPFGVFRPAGGAGDFRPGVAIWRHWPTPRPGRARQAKRWPHASPAP